MCVCVCLYNRYYIVRFKLGNTHIHTHMNIYIYIYIYIFMCVCMCVFLSVWANVSVRQWKRRHNVYILIYESQQAYIHALYIYKYIWIYNNFKKMFIPLWEYLYDIISKGLHLFIITVITFLVSLTTDKRCLYFYRSMFIIRSVIILWKPPG